jgi:D-alanine-D-alanine ligase-like ATP-grasp enzyme
MQNMLKLRSRNAGKPDHPHSRLVQLVQEGAGLKSAVMQDAAELAGLKVERLNRSLILATDAAGTIALPFRNMNGPHSSYAAMALCDRKPIAKKLLRASGLEVGAVESFRRSGVKAGARYAAGIGYPVVVKPSSSARGNGVTTGIPDEAALQRAWTHAMNMSEGSRYIVVERHFDGDDYRFFVVGGKVVSVTHRRRANVEGDGVSTVRALIERKNAIRLANIYVRSYLIPDDPAVLDRLAASGHDLDGVPAKGERVVLRGASNLSAGGDSIDVTDATHPSFLEVAIRALAAIPGMRYGGVDILARDIAQPATADNHIVGEVEFSPAPLSQFPLEGKPRDMAGAVVAYYLGRI